MQSVLQSEDDILLNKVISEAMDEWMRTEAEKFDKLDTSMLPPPSHHHKIQMNRIFRECVGGSFLPFPEEDNIFEKIRSKIIVKSKLNEFSGRKKGHKANQRKSK